MNIPFLHLGRFFWTDYMDLIPNRSLYSSAMCGYDSRGRTFIVTKTKSHTFVIHARYKSCTAGDRESITKYNNVVIEINDQKEYASAFIMYVCEFSD